MEASSQGGEGAVDVSLTYKPVAWNTEYLTADFNESPVTTNGGGYDGFTGDSITPTRLPHQELPL